MKKKKKTKIKKDYFLVVGVGLRSPIELSAVFLIVSVRLLCLVVVIVVCSVGCSGSKANCWLEKCRQNDKFLTQKHVKWMRGKKPITIS